MSMARVSASVLQRVSKYIESIAIRLNVGKISQLQAIDWLLTTRMDELDEEQTKGGTDVQTKA
jgi:hypothetical protein